MKFSKPIIYDELARDDRLTDEERSSLSSNLPYYLGTVTEKSKSGAYCCPFCNSGHGKKKTGALSIEQDEQGIWKWKCFKCGEHGDIFDLVGKIEHLETFPERVNRVRLLFGDGSTAPQAPQKKSPAPTSSLKAEATAEKEESKARLRDFTENYKEWTEHLQDTSYNRGITLYTLAQFNIGYCKEWRHPDRPNMIPTERLIIPISQYCYTARDINKGTGDEGKYMKVSSGKDRHLFNEKALDTAQSPIFIVEGELDALSIIDCGGEAIGLGSTSNVPLLLSLLQARDNNIPQALVLALDNDNAGKEAQDKLRGELEQRKIDYREFSYPEGYKDANTVLESDRRLLTGLVREVREDEERLKAEREKEYISNSSLKGFMSTYRDKMSDPDTGRAYPTGFNILDRRLEGGFREGLVVIGALSGLGKSTFLFQIACNMAEKGQDALYFSLEMNREELITRELSHLTYEKWKSGETVKKPKTQMDIYKGRGHWNSSEEALINKCLDRIESYSEHLYIFDGVGEISLETIRTAVKAHIRRTGRKPVVFVDYLQIVAPDKERNSDKMNTDNIILGLKKLSAFWHIPVVALSSFNRQSYASSVDMTCFKESGSIEYTADLALAIQPSAATTVLNYQYEAERQKDVIDIDIVFLKWRQGSTELNISGKFTKAYFTFEETGVIKYDYTAIRKLEKQRMEKEKRKKDNKAKEERNITDSVSVES